MKWLGSLKIPLNKFISYFSKTFALAHSRQKMQTFHVALLILGLYFFSIQWKTDLHLPKSNGFFSTLKFPFALYARHNRSNEYFRIAIVFVCNGVVVNLPSLLSSILCSYLAFKFRFQSISIKHTTHCPIGSGEICQIECSRLRNNFDNYNEWNILRQKQQTAIKRELWWYAISEWIRQVPARLPFKKRPKCNAFFEP